MLKRIAVAIGLVIVLALFLFGGFGSISVCDQCAAEGSNSDLQVPFLGLTYWRIHRESQTPLGELGVEFGFVQPHRHHWWFVCGGGTGCCCALGGAGRDMHRNARSERIVKFIRLTERYRGRKQARAWFDAALDERRSAGMHSWVDLFVPMDAVASKAEYEECRQHADGFAAKEWPELIGDGLLPRPAHANQTGSKP
jgi:hypothetical protein